MEFQLVSYSVLSMEVFWTGLKVYEDFCLLSFKILHYHVWECWQRLSVLREKIDGIDCNVGCTLEKSMAPIKLVCLLFCTDAPGAVVS